MPISTRIKPRPDASGDDRVCDIYRPINRIRPRPDANGDVNSTDTKLADQKKLEELTKLAVARHHEGYSYIATRLLGFAQPGANKAEIERVYSRLSQENKRSVMALSAALDKANRHAHNGLLLEGDSIPITGAEVQALLKR